MKHEGFKPQKYGLKTLKMKVVGSHGTHSANDQPSNFLRGLHI